MISAWLRPGSDKGRSVEREGRRKRKSSKGDEERESREPRHVLIQHCPPSTIPIQEVTTRQRLDFFAKGRRRLRLSMSSPNTASEKTTFFSSSKAMRRR
ncbi:hypothetical protein BHE74_00055232 [Ensete ventricosum]|nr:hypothetical protein BHE74_00055232 [Ensete ventricosum]